MQTIRFGTRGQDSLTTASQSVLFGFEGDDTLEARWNSTEYYQAFLVGGQGNDTYRFDGDLATIVDTGGQDTIWLPGAADDYEGAYVNDQDLLLVNAWTGQGVFILEAEGRGRIETFRTEEGESFSSGEVRELVYTQGYGSVNYEELEQLTGGLYSAGRFAATKEVNQAWANLDWDAVWQAIADGGDLSSEAIASVIDTQLTAVLSPRALDEWRGQMGLKMLQSSSFEGVEANLPAAGQAPDVSPELAQRVALLYEAALDRVPDESGLNYWIDRAASNMPFFEIADRFIDSEEFQQNFAVATPDDFIDQLYLNVLDRSADASGRDYWLGQLAEGMSQAEVLSRFSDSAENVENASWLSGLNETDSGWVIL